jgi:hypothetical protein
VCTKADYQKLTKLLLYSEIINAIWKYTVENKDVRTLAPNNYTTLMG